MFCSRCGLRVEEGNRFCQSCGQEAGAAVIAAPVAASALPPPILTLETDPVGLLNVDPAAPSAFVEADRATSSLEVLDHRSDRLLVGPHPTDLPLALQYGPQIAGWLVNGRHIVQLSYGTRTFGTTWRWDLDAPCGT